MGRKCSAKCLLRFLSMRLIEGAVIVLFLLFVPNIPPKCSFESTEKVSAPMPLEGKLAINNKLATTKLWHHGDLKGPESLAVYNNEIYTSLVQGDIVKLTGNSHITPVAKLGLPCRFEFEEKICGRPLGLQFDRNGNLYAADAYYGIYKINVKNGEKKQIVSPDVEIGGKKSKLFNNLAVASNGDIFWTDSSTNFALENGLFDLFADGSGRLVKYDAKTGKNTVLLDNLHFPNGIILSKGEDSLIVSETGRSRLLSYDLRTNTHRVFLDGLPGMPDNIRPDGAGGYLVPLVVAHDKSLPNLFNVLRPFPKLRKILARILGVIELNFQIVDNVYTNDVAKMGMHFIGHFTSVNSLFNGTRVTVLRVGNDGNIVDSLHDMTGKLVGISEATVYKDQLLLGSPYNSYIGRIGLREVGWTDLIQGEKSKAGEDSVKPTQAPVKQVPTVKPTQAPVKQVPTVKATPAPTVKATPAPTKQAPTVKATQAPTVKPTQAPVKATTVKPTQAPVKQAPTVKPTQAPVKQAQTVKPTQAPVKQAPTVKPSQAPVKQVPTVKATPAPTVKTTQTPVKQVPTVKATPAPVKQPPTVKATPAPVKQAPTVKASPSKEVPAGKAGQAPTSSGAKQVPKSEL